MEPGGSQLEIQALSEALNLKVHIHSKGRDPITIGPCSLNNFREVHLAFHPLQEHYDSVRSLAELPNSCSLVFTKNGLLDKRSKAFKVISSQRCLKRKAETPLDAGELKKLKFSPPY